MKIPLSFKHHLYWPVVLTIITLSTLFVASCQLGNIGQPETLTLGLPSLEQNALIYVAAEQGFFSANGLNVEIKEYDSGATAIDRLLADDVDLAGAAEFPVAKALVQKKPLGIIASYDKFENDYLIGRKDRGIQTISDLKGKRIGVALNTINEFYLGRFLELRGIQLNEVTPVDLKPAQFVDAITSGKVDALIAWQPYIHQALERQADMVTWPAQNNQFVYGLLIGNTEWLAEHGDLVERFIRSLHQAQTYLNAHPGEAQAIVQKRLNYDSSYLASVWPQHYFSLSLDYSLIIAMNDETHWMIEHHLVTAKNAPDFSTCVFPSGLQTVDPEAVNINR